MNSVSRILGQAKESALSLLISNKVFDEIELPKWAITECLGEFNLKGKEQKIELYGIKGE